MTEIGGLKTDGLDHLVGFLIALADVPARRVFQRHIGDPFDLRAPEFSLLLLLLANSAAAPKQLGQALAMSPPNVTALVDRMAARGLVVRRKSPTDGRGQQLLLTPKGEALARRLRDISTTLEDSLLAALSPGERALLRELLLKLARA